MAKNKTEIHVTTVFDGLLRNAFPKTLSQIVSCR